MHSRFRISRLSRPACDCAVANPARLPSVLDRLLFRVVCGFFCTFSVKITIFLVFVPSVIIVSVINLSKVRLIYSAKVVMATKGAFITTTR